LLLSSCGQKGPLYLPEAKTEAVSEAANEAPTASEAPAVQQKATNSPSKRSTDLSPQK
jgi:predicted small lipoprotein YifL